MSLYNPEAILTALKNTTTVEGALRVLTEVEPIYGEVENSFFGPQIFAELQRLRELVGQEVWTAQDEVVYRPLRRKKLRIEARQRKDLGGRFKRYGARKRKLPPDS